MFTEGWNLNPPLYGPIAEFISILKPLFTWISSLSSIKSYLAKILILSEYLKLDVNEVNVCSTPLFDNISYSKPKRNLSAGEILDGEGGYSVWGCIVPKTASLSKKALPIGLARNVALKTDIGVGQIVTLNDVTRPSEIDILDFRKEMENVFWPIEKFFKSLIAK